MLENIKMELFKLFKHKKNTKMAVNKDLIKSISDALAEQVAKQIAQAIEQTSQTIGQSTQGADQFSSRENKLEEINTGEAHRRGVLANQNSWDANIKYLFDKSQDYDRAFKELELSESRAKTAKVVTQQHVESIISLVTALSAVNGQIDVSKFHAAVSEPLSPDTGSDDKDSDK